MPVMLRPRIRVPPAGAGAPPLADAPRPEAEAIRELLAFVAAASQKHPELFLAADNPVLEVCSLNIRSLIRSVSERGAIGRYKKIHSSVASLWRGEVENYF